MEADLLDKSRTVVVSGVPDVLPFCRMCDKLTVHFQSRRRSHGGDVEVVTYPTNKKGVAFVTFDKAKDAERVVRKEQQIMTDSKFPEEYVLTVFPFSRDVFFYVSSAKVDLSLLGSDQGSLIQTLRSTHKSVRFRFSSHERKATIEGPFAAVKALREDLIRRAGQLQSAVPNATAKLRESPPNPRVISHREFVGSVSCSASKARQEPAGSNGLSALLHSTGEATEVQSLLSNAKAPNSARHKVQSRGDADTDEGEELKAGSRLRLSTEYSTEGAKAKRRQMLGEEMNAGIRSSSSGPRLQSTEKASAKQPAVDDISQKHTKAERISGRGTYLDCDYNSDYVKLCRQSSSSVKNTLVSVSSKSSAGTTEDLSAGCPQDPEDTSIWVDSYIFRYIVKLDRKEYDRCLRDLNVSVEEGSEFVRICLSENQPSKASLRIQQALGNLKALVEFWQLTLRVHEIQYNKKEYPKQKLIQICDEQNIAGIYDDVLYMIEDSKIKVVGPSISSYLYHKRLEKRLNGSNPSKAM